MTTSPHTKVFIYDDLHPEDNAMLQALYSRSPASVVTHLAKVKASGSGKFMESYYVGYGHASIGDCGTTTLFIENVSMLAAKAIQDNPLYSGQEASTRYLDFSTQPLINPLNTPESHAILQKWMEIYNTTLPLLKEAVAREHPFNPNDYKNETTWKKAIAARAFDIARSFIPLGCATLLSWTTNLRQARELMMRLCNHPLEEVRTMAQMIFKDLYAKYPNSFTGEEMNISSSRYAARHAYEAKHGSKDHHQSWEEIIQRYQFTPTEQTTIKSGDIITRTRHMDIAGIIRDEMPALSERPAGAALPQRIKNYGVVEMSFALDYGAFKDLQRHRGGLAMHRIPLIDTTFGFGPWFLKEFERLLPDNGKSVLTDISKQMEAIQHLQENGANPFHLQYLYTHGISSPHTLAYTLPQVIYVAELRSQQTVHPTLRPLAQHLALWAKETFPGIAIHADMTADAWSPKRGEQDITSKAA